MVNNWVDGGQRSKKETGLLKAEPKRPVIPHENLLFTLNVKYPGMQGLYALSLPHFFELFEETVVFTQFSL